MRKSTGPTVGEEEVVGRVRDERKRRMAGDGSSDPKEGEAE